MSTRREYLYGVIPARHAKDFGPIGLGGQPVRTICDGEFGILASTCEPIDFQTALPKKTLHCLAQHQRVLEQVMANAPVVPLKFGTYADNGEQISRIIDSGRKQFADALAAYGDKVEFDIAAFWSDVQGVLADIADDERVVAMKDTITAEQAPTFEQRVSFGRLVKQLLDERRGQAACELLNAIQTIWPNVVVNPTRDDAMVLNAAVLIGRDEQSLFDKVISDLNGRCDERFNFRCVGPLPPYSFATANIRTIDAAALDTARQSLELGESASLAEIKTAYRRLLQENHPDRSAAPGAADRMREIAGAYELLEEFAVNYRHAFGSVLDGPIIVKVRSLNDLRSPGSLAQAARPQQRRDMATVQAA